MKSHPRCLYTSDFISFLFKDINSIFGTLCDNYHGDAPTTSREAWKSEIEIMRSLLIKLNDRNGQIIFEYDIPRLGKRIDVVLLYRGIVFCLEFKVGESRILEADIDQVLDYALDLKNFHKFSEDRVITPILIATNYTDAEFCKEHPIINFDTLSGFGEYQVVAVFKFDTNHEDFRYNEYTQMNEEQFKEFMSQVHARQCYDTGIDAEYGDQLITLSTCEYTYNNGRFVVVAKEV